MRNWFNDLPIRRKLVVITLASSALALLLASGGFFAWDILRLRGQIQDDLSVEARIIGQNSAAALTFNDPQAAGETLAVLQLRPRVEMSCLYAENGQLFAAYHRGSGTACPPIPADARTFTWGGARLVMPVMLENRRVGTLFVQRDVDDVRERAAVGAVTVAALLVLASFVAVLVAGRLQRVIVMPLLHLADTARAVSNAQDYSIRAELTSQDEVGVVIRTFNTMLDRVQESTAELSRANRLKDEFLATLSHELRTPLNAVLGWTRILRSAEVPPQTEARALESIERNAQAQQRLIEDMLDISRIVAGKLRLETRATDLAVVIKAAVEIVQPAASAKRIRLMTDVQTTSAVVTGDPDRLQQVVWNLLSNAVKFTPAGGTVTIRLARDGAYVLSVTDTGAGIDPTFLPHIFELFRQADSSPSREHGGLGLGLAIVRRIVEMHGGTVAARSAGVGKGATFEVRLPADVTSDVYGAPPPSSLAPATTAHVDPTLLSGVDVLVVDDEEDARQLLQTTLESHGARVTVAASTAEAIRAFERRLPDVIVSDIGMAVEDGYALMRRIRARPASAGGRTPAIALTAYASDADREAALAAGYQAHVAKPFQPWDLARLVRRLTGTHTRI